MQAYYEMETYIPNNHQLHLTLPNEIPEGTAKLAIIYELPISLESKVKKMANFLNCLPDNAEGGLTCEQINQHIQAERDSWEE